MANSILIKTFRSLAAALLFACLGCRPATSITRATADTASSPTAIISRAKRPRSVSAVVQACGPEVRRELDPVCRANGISYPPGRITLLAFKEERLLEVWGANRTGSYRRIAFYPILAASGNPGPKRREGDMQVPEGFYRLTDLNPLSQFHLSMRVDYPNEEDIEHAVVPRRQLGGDIYVHGNRISAGCIALGDAAIERVFTLAAQAQPNDRRILISPVDFRADRPAPSNQSPWTRDLYSRLRKELAHFK